MTSARDSLLSCMKEKSFPMITITDVARKAGITRATVYRYFDTPADILEYLCDSLMEEAATAFRKVRDGERWEYYSFLFRYLMERSDALEAIYSSHRLDIFQKSFSEYVDTNMPEIHESFSASESDFIKAVISSAFSSIIFVWIRHGKKESAFELTCILERSLHLRSK